MKRISTAAHAAIDYFYGILLIAISWLPVKGFTGVDTAVLNVAGILVLLYSMLTNYELGFICVIPMRVHLLLDVMLGLLLLASPWLLNLSDGNAAFFIVPGVFAILAGLLSKTKTSSDCSLY